MFFSGSSITKMRSMRTVLRAKADSCLEFSNISGSNYIVEATNAKYWGCGLSSISNAMYTLPEYHPGKNRLGHLMMELRESMTIRHQNLHNNVSYKYKYKYKFLL